MFWRFWRELIELWRQMWRRSQGSKPVTEVREAVQPGTPYKLPTWGDYLKGAPNRRQRRRREREFTRFRRHGGNA